MVLLPGTTNYNKINTMKKFIKSPLNLFFAGLLIASSFTFIQCTKPDTVGQIIFTYLSTGKPVEGATVKLFMDTSFTDAGFFLCGSNNHEITPSENYVTNSSGVITQCFDLPALINVYATLTTALGDTVGLDSLTKAIMVANMSVVGEGKLNLIANEKVTLEIEMN